MKRMKEMVNFRARKSGKVDYLGSYQRKIITVTKMEMNFKLFRCMILRYHYIIQGGFKIIDSLPFDDEVYMSNFSKKEIFRCLLDCSRHSLLRFRKISRMERLPVGSHLGFMCRLLPNRPPPPK